MSFKEGFDPFMGASKTGKLPLDRQLLYREEVLQDLETLEEYIRIADEIRPRFRSQCPDLELGPCPFVGCRHHLFLQVNEKTGNITFNYPRMEIDEIGSTCAYEVIAGDEKMSLKEIGDQLGISPERVRQIEINAKINFRKIVREDCPDIIDDIY